MFLNIVSVIKDACKGPLELGKQQRKSMSLWFYIPDFGLIQLPTDNFKIKKKKKKDLEINVSGLYHFFLMLKKSETLEAI